jgi:hypothetical protein
MSLMLAAMVVAVTLGMLFRKHEGAWRIMILLLSTGVTALYIMFADSFIK